MMHRHVERAHFVAMFGQRLLLTLTSTQASVSSRSWNLIRLQPDFMAWQISGRWASCPATTKN